MTLGMNGWHLCCSVILHKDEAVWLEENFMIGVILTGHAGFADGMASAVRLIGGEQEKFAAVNFVEGDSGESLAEKLQGAVEELGCAELVFCTDLPGGTPFNQSVLLSSRLSHECRVFTGTNLPFLLTILFDREDSLAECLARWQEPEYRVTMFSQQKREHKAQGGGI